MGDLVAFLRARIDEEAEEARAAAEKAGSGDWRFKDDDDCVSAVDTNERAATDAPTYAREHWMPLVTEASSYIGDTIDNEIGRFIARHDPTRVLAEVAAKRRILRWHLDEECCSVCLDDVEGCPLFRALALPYAGHPDYREERRP
ncbi:DUF6221 family protein [Streptomyces sp. NPDC007025]|uniref:DUF6221 family protein n=1 Tax=Streptomyces sp. NPDC007025 TaxID=3364771 RepID=UPI003699FFDC